MDVGLRRGAVWSTLLMGALFGAFNLAVVHLHLRPNPPSHNQTHAGFQIWAFAFLLTAPTTRPRLLLWGTLAAQLLVGWGRVGDVLPFGVPSMLAGSLLQLALACSTRSPGWIAAALLLAAGGVDALLDGDAMQANRWNQAVYAAALLGAVLPGIQGELRDVHRPRVAAAARMLAPLGAAILVVAWMTRSMRVVDVGLVVVAASTALFSTAWRPRVPALRIAKGGLHLFTLAAFVCVATGSSGLALDATRHAFTIGFVLPALFARAFPERRLGPAAGLMLAGAVLRQAQVVAALAAAPAWLWVSGLSGLVAAAGVVLAAFSRPR